MVDSCDSERTPLIYTPSHISTRTHYFQPTDAIIFVVDSCDSERLGVAKQELMAMLEVHTLPFNMPR